MGCSILSFIACTESVARIANKLNAICYEIELISQLVAPHCIEMITVPVIKIRIAEFLNINGVRFWIRDFRYRVVLTSSIIRLNEAYTNLRNQNNYYFHLLSNINKFEPDCSNNELLMMDLKDNTEHKTPSDGLNAVICGQGLLRAPLSINQATI